MANPVSATTPIAEVLCAPRAEMVEKLTKHYRAQISGQGVRNMEMVIEVWTDARGDWTLVQSYADGRACILAMGVGWDTVAPADPA